MSYAAQETSVQSGAPIELYAFSHGSSAWYYTSAEIDYIDASASPTIDYTSASIERGTIESTPEAARNALKLTVPRNLAVAELFRVSPPTDVVSVTVRRIHRGDPTSGIVIWIGRVLSCTFEGAQATLTCEPITVSMQRTGLRRIYSLSCPHVLYGTQCGVVKASFASIATVTAISGTTLYVSAITDYEYGGGIVEWVNGDGNTERRFIEAGGSSGSPAQYTLSLMQAFVGIAVNDQVTVYPGCNHTLTTCDTQFSNAVNFGGFPYIPALNPFAGDPVF